MRMRLKERIDMKKQIAILKLFLILTVVMLGSKTCFCQGVDKIDDKTKVRNALNSIPVSDPIFKSSFIKAWERLTDVEEFSLHLGGDYASCFYGVSLGGSWSNFLLDFNVKAGTKKESSISDNIAKIFPRQCSWVITPQFYLKYLSLGIGAGGISNLEEKTSFSVIGNEQFSIENTYSEYENNWYFCYRPEIRLIIPVYKDQSLFSKYYPLWFLYFSVGYNIVPENTNLNSANFGLGLKMNLEFLDYYDSSKRRRNNYIYY